MNFKKASLALMIAAASTQATAATVSGKVIDESGRPVVGAKITIKGTNLITSTNENGIYEIADVDPGHVHVHAFSSDHVHGDQEFDNIADAITVDFVLESTIIENIVVTATSLRSSVLESVTPVTVLTGDELRKRQAPTLGETLKSTPGIQSSYFGPVAASPIIRGTDGPRIKIVQNTLDVSDASRVGVDHNVAAEAASAKQIEVLRGPATLQYGSGAIGGVVNVVDNRVPSELPDGLDGELEVRHETASNERFAKADVTGSVGNVAFHIDGFTRETDDIEIPGFANIEPEEGAERGILPSSAIDTNSVTAGISYIDNKGYIGLSFQGFQNLYGVPGEGEGEEEEGGEEEGGVSIDADFDRYQLIGELYSPVKGISSVKLAASYTDYQHVEIEGDEFGTLFANDTTEVRLSAEHDAVAGWHGVFGLHYSNSDFLAQGEEAFTPPSETDSIALFVVEEKKVGDVTIQLGGRIDSNDVEGETFEVSTGAAGGEVGGLGDGVFEFDEQSFTNLSLSAGANWVYQEGYSAAFNISRSERAPASQELFSGGEHLATQTFEVGLLFDIDENGVVTANPNGAEEEVSTNIDLTFRKFTGAWGYTISFFYNQVDDYIFLAETGLSAIEVGEDGSVEEGLPIFVFLQEDADLFGFESEFYAQLNDVWRVKVFGDLTRAEIETDDLPRTPPLRIGAELSFQTQHWFGDIGATFIDDQNRTSEFETPTDGYTLLEAGVNYTHTTSTNNEWIFFLRGTNLTDRQARVHTSFLVDQAPLPGRGFTLGARLLF
jgi:iron complex outermembrane receptor protein